MLYDEAAQARDEDEREDPASRAADEQLRQLLERALRAQGYGKLVPGPRPIETKVDDLLIAALLALGAAFGYWAALSAAGASWPLAALGAVAILAVILGVILWEDSDALWSVWLYGASIVIGALWMLYEEGWTVVLTHVVPMTGTVLLVFVVERFELSSLKRTLTAIKSVLKNVPLLFPLIALVLFALILTGEIWQTANTESLGRLLALSAVVIIPVTLLLGRTLVASIDATFEKAAKDVKERNAPAEDVDQLLRARGHRHRRSALDASALVAVRASFEKMDAAAEARSACHELAGGFKRRITARLILTVIFVGVSAFIIIYGLTWLTVGEELAAEWTVLNEAEDRGSAASIEHWAPLGLSIPVGPYVKVSALLAILAVAIFIAFIFTTDSLSTEFRDAYIQAPATTALLLAVPYGAVQKRLAPPADEATADANVPPP